MESRDCECSSSGLPGGVVKIMPGMLLKAAEWWRGMSQGFVMPQTMDWVELKQGAHRFLKWVREEAGVIAATLFLVLFTFIVMSQSDRPFFSAVSGPEIFSYENLSTDVGLAIKQPFMTGNEAVLSFRAHLQCFGESGKWVYDPTPRHLPWNYVGTEDVDSCEVNHRLADPGNIGDVAAEDIALRGAPGNWSVREDLKWVWRTNNSCPWRPMNRDDFCRKVGSKGNIMVVGDSVNQEISWALMNTLIGNNTSGYAYNKLGGDLRKVLEPYEMCGDIFGEGHGFSISYVRNDRLSPVVNDTVDVQTNFYEFGWLDLVEELGTKTILMNRGAHYEDDEKYQTGLREIFTILTQQHPHIHVIYRSTQPGHVDCHNFTRPLSEPQHDIPFIFHWDEFHRQNLLAQKIVEEFHYTYMNVYPMLSLRADSHRGDCLHFCLPGPPDLAVEYIYNILSLI